MRTDIRTDGHDEANNSHFSQFYENISEIVQLERNSVSTNKINAVDNVSLSSCISSSLSFAFEYQ